MAEDNTSSLKAEHIKHPVFEIETDSPAIVLEQMEKGEFVYETSLFGNKVHVETDTSIQTSDEMLGKIQSVSAEKIIRVDRIVPTLEDVFIALVDKKGKS